MPDKLTVSIRMELSPTHAEAVRALAAAAGVRPATAAGALLMLGCDTWLAAGLAEAKCLLVHDVAES